MRKRREPPRDWTGLGVGFLCGVALTVIIAYAVVKGWM